MVRGRREVMMALLAGAAATVSLAPDKAKAARRAPRADASAALGVVPGMRFAASTVRGVGPLALGAIPVRLVDADGRPFTLEILRHDPVTPGVARGGSLGVYVCNDGDGALTTDEPHGLAALAIARQLEEREAAGAEVPSLLTLRERAGRRLQPSRARQRP
jgi:hypothetical protein